MGIVVMEVRGNLLEDERKKLLGKFAFHRKIARVVAGNPPADFQVWVQDELLQEKTTRAKAEHQRLLFARRKATEERRKRRAEEKKWKQEQVKREVAAKEAADKAAAAAADKEV